MRAAIEAIWTARAEVDAVVAATPDRVQRNVRGALASMKELEGHGVQLATRADELSKYLVTVDLRAATAEAEQLAQRTTTATDPTARADYESAALAATERLQALRDIGAARKRTLAHLARIASAIGDLRPHARAPTGRAAVASSAGEIGRAAGSSRGNDGWHNTGASTAGSSIMLSAKFR